MLNLMQKYWPRNSLAKKSEPEQWSSTVTALLLSLLVIVASLLMSGCSSVPVTVQPSLSIPTVCKLKCPLPPLPPETNDENLRREWEFDLMKDAGSCYALHDACGKQLKEQGVVE